MSKEFSWVQHLIAVECDSIKELLLEKNQKYGNSALEPCRMFSKASAIEQLKVRIDDKLKRIQTTGERTSEGKVTDEDTTQDLIGYLVLLRVAQRLEQSGTNAEPYRGPQVIGTTNPAHPDYVEPSGSDHSGSCFAARVRGSTLCEPSCPVTRQTPPAESTTTSSRPGILSGWRTGPSSGTPGRGKYG